MNIKLYTYFGAPDLWLDYSEWGGDLQLESIYAGSDKARINLIDFMSESVIAHAEKRMAEDFAETEREFNHD